MKYRNHILAILVATNLFTGTWLYEKTISLQQWEDASRALDPESVGQAVDASLTARTAKCRTSQEVLRALIARNSCNHE